MVSPDGGFDLGYDGHTRIADTNRSSLYPVGLYRIDCVSESHCFCGFAAAMPEMEVRLHHGMAVDSTSRIALRGEFRKL